MNPSQIKYNEKDLVFLRGVSYYFPHEMLESKEHLCQRDGFASITWVQAEGRYEPSWCNHPLLIIEELPPESNRQFQGTAWNYHTYRGRFVVCLNSNRNLVVFPRDHLVRVEDVIET